jgi:uncharacterized protein involved in type VI secretion and phage assembly
MDSGGATQALLGMQRTQFFGKYRGLVTENHDDLKRGRVQVQVPQVLGLQTVWALPCVAYAGKDVGLFAMPKIGTVVWVEFEAGDPSFPIWTGCSWALGDIADADAVPTVKFFKTDKFTIRIDDDGGELRIEDTNGTQIIITPSNLVLKSSTTKVQGGGGREVAVDTTSVKVNQTSMEVK